MTYFLSCKSHGKTFREKLGSQKKKEDKDIRHSQSNNLDNKRSCAIKTFLYVLNDHVIKCTSTSKRGLCA